MADTYKIRTKDGITITAIPGNVTKDAPELKDKVRAIRATRKGLDPVKVAFTDEVGPKRYGFDVPGANSETPSVETAMGVGEKSIDVGTGQTDALGILGAVERPLIPPTVGATIGGLSAGPAGALAGAGISQVVFSAGDLMVPLINKLFNTKYNTPTEALNFYLTKAGIAVPDSEFERIMQTAFTGVAGSIGGMGAGQILKGVGTTSKLGASTATQGVGQAMMEGPASQIMGGAGAGAASEIAAAAGAGPIPQMAAGLAGGIVGSRLAPGRPALTRPSTPRVQTAEQAAADIGTLVKKASSPGFGRASAREKLVALAEINPDAYAAAKRQGFDLPADVFSDNPQVRAAAGLARSAAGSESEGIWKASVANALDRADDVITQFDATFAEGSIAPGVVSERVKDSVMKTREALHAEATKLYYEIDQTVPKQTPVRLEKLSAMLDEITSEVGEGGLSSQEKALRNMIKQNPTYGRLLREKNLIGQAIARKESPYGNMETGALKRLYGALAEDQIANVDEIGRWQTTEKLLQQGANVAPTKEGAALVFDDTGKKVHVNTTGGVTKRINADGSLGEEVTVSQGRISPVTSSDVKDSSLGEKLRSANLIYAKERALGDRIVDMFGSDIEGSITNKMKTAIVSSSKGDAEALNKLMNFVPEDLRRETMATAIGQVARNSRGEFGFAEYAKAYKGLRGNPTAYARVVKELGEGGDQVLRDLYEVSKRITDARGSVLTTGKANQVLLQNMSAENLVAKVMKSTLMRAATTAGTVALGGGPIGAGAASMITSAIAGGNRDALKAAGKLFASPKFQALVEAAARGQMPNLDVIRATAQSSAFDNFARTVKLPVKTQQREMWILSTLQGQIEEGVQQ